ncbi:sulfotransferase [Phycicoccus endophyticus]|uniref:Sulfotransferase n=1 Tax=Phycicoccus endophyticus TaxID=1690220 RepID=A0A7G9R325_9MICO|nr:sulfotransferase [Phycicoccus endophyticus]NHI20295.1 sulfotransferase domain-containing protein [Phycicoccus endophyticus]QNN50000.1 sulfotransferase [Phycicoccus endophyticus]GGL28967.1 hypothetical protein GCM10012283_09020 [Phycicoccus endophyticus]
MTYRNGSPLVDFAIVGEPKSGTTALAQFLAEHPGVALSVPKESSYFSTDFRRESDAYHGRPVYFSYRTSEQFAATYAHAEEGQLLGDASTSYAYSAEAADNLHDHNPDLRVILMVRNPVTMLHALHMQYVNETVEDIEDFAEALAAEEDRKAGRRLPARVRVPSYLFYRERVRFADHIEKFHRVFGPEQVLVLVNEDFRRDNAGGYERVLRFIGADTSVSVDFAEVHGSKAPRFKRLNAVLNSPRAKKTLYSLLGGRAYTRVRSTVARAVMKEAPREQLDPALRRSLERKLRPEVERLSGLLGRDMAAVWGFADEPDADRGESRSTDA